MYNKLQILVYQVVRGCTWFVLVLSGFPNKPCTVYIHAYMQFNLERLYMRTHVCAGSTESTCACSPPRPHMCAAALV
jgi:hypothetical protein